ncbi:hypothetical protein [Paraburkholderia bannensis]|uniref:hypothetical protein n=1 Tax=Paraburkholderia bannensis TaxID=765414 RepID=UPI002AB7AD3F|nr:hypothetical protein [Paraburkholderia bannensis]
MDLLHKCFFETGAGMRHAVSNIAVARHRADTAEAFAAKPNTTTASSHLRPDAIASSTNRSTSALAFARRLLIRFPLSKGLTVNGDDCFHVAAPNRYLTDSVIVHQQEERSNRRLQL